MTANSPSLSSARTGLEPERIVLPKRAGAESSYEIVFVGDTYLGESYEAARIRRGLAPDYADRDASSFFDGVRHFVAGADFGVANLEAPLPASETSRFAGRKKRLHRGDATVTTAALKELGVRAVSLANNHSGDYGFEGLTASIDALSRRGILSLGVGLTPAEAARPVLLEMAGARASTRLAIVAAYDVRPSIASFYEEAVDPGAMNRVEQDELHKQIAALRSADPELYIVVFVHWGRNYQATTARQRRLAKVLAAEGANLVIGHGAHTIQEFERIDRAVVVYSIGNFVFNSPGRYESFGSEPVGLVARLLVRPDFATPLRLRLHPIVTDNRQTGYRSRPLALEMLESLARRYAGRGLEDMRIRPRDRSIEIPLFGLGAATEDASPGAMRRRLRAEEHIEAV